MPRALAKNILKNVRYKDWTFFVGQDGDREYLQVQFAAHDPQEPMGFMAKGRKWLLSPYMTKSEIVQTAFKAVIAAEEHETREFFLYKGKAIFGPHFDVETLVTIADETERR